MCACREGDVQGPIRLKSKAIRDQGVSFSITPWAWVFSRSDTSLTRAGEAHRLPRTMRLRCRVW
jgi:hypothetical protein